MQHKKLSLVQAVQPHSLFIAGLARLRGTQPSRGLTLRLLSAFVKVALDASMASTNPAELERLVRQVCPGVNNG